MEYKNHRLAWKGRYLDEDSEDYREGYRAGLSACRVDLDLIQIHLQRLEQAIEGLARKLSEPEKKED